MNVKYIFCCGIDNQTLQSKLANLSEDNQRRLERVAIRVGVSLKIRYELTLYRKPFPSPNDEFLINQVELPALEIYLLVTCLDTLAGQAVHKRFPDWLKQQPDLGQIGLEEISTLFAEYEEEYGVNKNIRRLFKNLSKNLKEWLAQNVSIRLVDDTLNPNQQDPDILAENLSKYFFDIRRNGYTHSSIVRQVATEGDIFLPQEKSGWITPAGGTHFSLDRGKPKKKWNFSYRPGVDESTILRLIIHSAALQILDIEATQELILLNLKNYSRMDALYSFISEVTSNANLLKSWPKIDSSRASDIASYLIFSGIPTLNEEASVRMIDRYELRYPREQGFEQMTRQYLNEVRSLNSVIDGFNQANPRLRSTEGDIDGRWQLVKNFLTEQANLPVYKILIKWPAMTEMTNLWLTVRDPCYT